LFYLITLVISDFLYSFLF